MTINQGVARLLGITALTMSCGPFSDIGRNRDCRSAHLRRHTELFFARKTLADHIVVLGQIYRKPPHVQVRWPIKPGPR